MNKVCFSTYSFLGHPHARRGIACAGDRPCHVALRVSVRVSHDMPALCLVLVPGDVASQMMTNQASNQAHRSPTGNALHPPA